MIPIEVLKRRIFGIDTILENEPKEKISDIELLLEMLTSENGNIAIVSTDEDNAPTKQEELEQQVILVEYNEEREIKAILYEIEENIYYVYTRSKSYLQQDEKGFDIFIPSGIVVRRVPQHILGTGILGRAFIHSNYIEILDSLFGQEYNEVLTHEVFHILYPEKNEQEIRQITRNYLGNTIYN